MLILQYYFITSTRSLSGLLDTLPYWGLDFDENINHILEASSLGHNYIFPLMTQ